MTSYAVLEYLQTILQDNWTASVTGRINDVPQPVIKIAADENVRRVTQSHDHIIFVTEGSVDATPRSLNWSEKKVDADATLDIRTSGNRATLEGTRDANNERERYGGLSGEVERILDSVRKGDKEFDWIDGYEYRALSEEVGYGFWRGAWEVRTTELARTIDPST